jgi:iron uptake system EfeUOB component EfeO/EfeM
MYRDYAVRQLGTMEGDVGRLAGALASGNRDGAKSAWRRAFADYLSLGAVYVGGRMAELDQAIDGTSAGITGGTASPKFTGLHRLEFGLWTNRSLASLKPWARTLADDVAELRHELPRLEITPTDYVTRAHEILEDALRDQLTGVDVPWSGEGVLGASAALAATTEVVRTLASLLSTSQGPREAVDSALRGLRSTITTLRARHGGVVPTVARLSQSEHERLDASVGGALTALAQVPASLEVEGTRPTQTPTIPAAASRADR